MDIFRRYSKYLIPSSILLAVLLIYYPSFSSYYFQDDWFSLLISRATRFKDLLQFFIPRSDVIYYRPLGMQLPFYVMKSIFGLNPFPFRLLTLFLHLFNGYVLYKFLTNFVASKKLRLIAATLYLTSAVHMIVFYWSATFAFALIPTFYLFGFSTFIEKKYVKSLGFFLLGILTNELIVTLPMMIFIYLLLNKQKRECVKLLPFGVILLLYFILRKNIGSIPNSGDYALFSGIAELVKNLRIYSFWVFNWPDGIQDQIRNVIFIDSLYIKSFSWYVFLFTLNTITALTAFIIFPLRGYRKFKNQEQLIKTCAFGVSWFIITLIPVLVFKHHYYSYYLPIPLIGLLMSGIALINAYLQSSPKHDTKMTVILFVCLCVWVLSSYSNIRLSILTHWAPRRAKISQKYSTALQSKFPSLPSNSSLYIPAGERNEEIKWALGEQSAARFLYSDVSIKTFFTAPSEMSGDLSPKYILQLPE